MLVHRPGEADSNLRGRRNRLDSVVVAVGWHHQHVHFHDAGALELQRDRNVRAYGSGEVLGVDPTLGFETKSDGLSR